MPPQKPIPATPPGISPFLSKLTETGSIHILPVDSVNPTGVRPNGDILDECCDLNIIETSLRERLHTKIAQRRAEQLRSFKAHADATSTSRQWQTTTTPIYADPLKLNDAMAANPLPTPPGLASQYKVVSAWPPNLIERVQAVIRSPCTQPLPTEFKFDLSHDAAAHNAEVLRNYNFDLGKAIDTNKHSPLGYGSEFRHTTVLSLLFERHPNWDRFRSIITNGSRWPLDELADEARSIDLQDALTFRNHKGASAHPKLLRKLVEKDVNFGFGLVIPLSTVNNIPGALIAPMNIMEQNTIDEHGTIIPKQHLTHDQSFKWTSGTSVNSRVNFTKCLPCGYGACLQRLINFMVAAHRKYPDKRLLATKIDYKSAYQRCHLNHETAAQTITQLPEEELAIISLRLTFGGAPCPYEWSVISESVCDLANALLHDDNWDPTNLSSPSGVPPLSTLDDNAPFGIGRKQIVDIPIDPRGTINCYIDDTIGITVDLDNTNKPLAIHAVSRPLHPHEPIPRDEMTAEQKRIAEGGLEETNTILGWFFNLRRMTVALPENKFVAWSASISSMLAAEQCTPRDLEQLIGCLGHLGSILPLIHHFLSRLRDLHFKSRNRQRATLMENCVQDLKLMQQFLSES